MATTEYNQDQSGLRSELDEPRRTTESEVQNKEQFDTPAPQQDQEKDSYFPTSEEGGYGGVSEEEPPHHKIHSEDEPLPKPKSGTYDDESIGAQGDSNPITEEPRDEQVIPQPTSTDTSGGYGDEGSAAAQKSTEDYQDYRSSEPLQQGPVDGKQKN